MKPLQSLRAWWRARRFRLQVDPVSQGVVMIGVFSTLNHRERDGVIDDGSGYTPVAVGIACVRAVSLVWWVPLRPALTPAQLAFRRTRRSARRVLFVSALAAAAVIAWATYVAVSWYDGKVSGVLSGIHTGVACAVLCLIAGNIAGCLSDIRAAYERELLTVGRQTPAR